MGLERVGSKRQWHVVLRQRQQDFQSRHGEAIISLMERSFNEWFWIFGDAELLTI
jgi:hypothetical protein